MYLAKYESYSAVSAFNLISQRLGYIFQQPDLLHQALTHRSYGMPHNERLEFLGDSVLNCAVAKELYRLFPMVPEGDLSRLRANLVNQQTLFEIAHAFPLGEYIRLGEGELKSGGIDRPSILADALEAIFGAILLDGGFAAAERVILLLYADLLSQLDPKTLGKDPKTFLQEYLQGRKIALPRYTLINTLGEAHQQHFQVECVIEQLHVRTLGEGQSRRSAEQNAAQNAYQQLKKHK